MTVREEGGRGTVTDLLDLVNQSGKIFQSDHHVVSSCFGNGWNIAISYRDCYGA